MIARTRARLLFEALESRQLMTVSPTIGASSDVGALLHPVAPAGAIVFNPSQTAAAIESSVQAHPGGTFFFDAGTYKDVSIAPLTGDTFIGQFGTTLTGTTAQHAFESANPNVTIQNFVITGYQAPQYSGTIQADVTTNWTIDHCEISNSAYVALAVLDGSTVTNNYVHNNAVAGLGADSLAGYTGQPTHWTTQGAPILIQNNLIADNNPNGTASAGWDACGLKIWECNNCTIANNTLTDNIGNGIWLDTCRGGDVVENNLVTGSTNYAIFNEITNGSLITNNTVTNGALQSVVVWNGANVTVSYNTITGPQSVIYPYTAPHNDDGTTWVLKNLQTYGNTLNGAIDNPPPVPWLLLNNPTANNTTTFTNSGPVAIGNAGHVSVIDGKSGNLVSLTASIASPHTGDLLIDNTAGTSIVSSYNSGTGVLTLSGSDTLTHYQQVLASVAYNNTAGNPGVSAETVSVVASDGTNSSTVSLATININVNAKPSSVSAVNLFYDNSNYNNNVEGVNAASDDSAIDTSKTAYLPGTGTATFANLSSYTAGINGIMVDLAIGGAHANLNASDFTFRVGSDNASSAWATAPAPSTISVRSGAGIGGSDRVELTWTDGSITDEWLEVSVRADTSTGLNAPYTFFYGSQIGNSNTGNTRTTAFVTSTDEDAVRSHSGTATLTNVNAPYDFNRDGFVNSDDEDTARSNTGSLGFIKITANTPLAPDDAPVVAPDVTIDPAVTTDTAAATLGSGDTGLATGLANLLNNVKTAALSPVPLDWLPIQPTNLNLNSGAATTIFADLADADTDLAPSILPDTATVEDETGLDGALVDSILVEWGME